MKKSNYFYRLSLFVMLLLTYLITVNCSSEDVEDITDTDINVEDNNSIEDNVKDTITIVDTKSVSIENASFGNYSLHNPINFEAYYYFGANYTSTINVKGYNEDYTYQLKLTGKYFGKEYLLSLNSEESNIIVKEEDGVKNISELIPISIPVKDVIEEEDITVSLTVDLTNLDLEVDDYTATIVEVESEEEMDVNSSDALLAIDAKYKTYIIDNDATNFLSGTQLESNDWAKLTELNLNTHSSFRVRPTIVNYINGIAVVLGIYDLDANKIGYISSNGSNGSVNNGTYSYKFLASRVNDLISENGEYLVRLEERTSTIDANDTGYRNGLFQKIQITKIVEEVAIGKDIIVALEAK